jgi:hypothetical protein
LSIEHLNTQNAEDFAMQNISMLTDSVSTQTYQW